MDTDLLNRILPQAHQQGFLKPSERANECLVSTINTANYLLYLLDRAEDNGMTTAQITHHSRLNKNTCKCYLRQLVALGLVKRVPDGAEVIWFLKTFKSFAKRGA